MPLFQIRPNDQSQPSADVIATDASQVLGIVQSLDCKDADVLRDGVYAYSIRHNANGVWCIYQRDEPELCEPAHCDEPMPGTNTTSRA